MGQSPQFSSTSKVDLSWSARSAQNLNHLDVSGGCLEQIESAWIEGHPKGAIKYDAPEKTRPQHPNLEALSAKVASHTHFVIHQVPISLGSWHVAHLECTPWSPFWPPNKRKSLGDTWMLKTPPSRPGGWIDILGLELAAFWWNWRHLVARPWCL